MDPRAADLRLARRAVRPVVSSALLNELTTVLGRPKFDRWTGNERAARWIASLSAGGNHREDRETPPVGIRDPKVEGGDFDSLETEVSYAEGSTAGQSSWPASSSALRSIRPLRAIGS